MKRCVVSVVLLAIGSGVNAAASASASASMHKKAAYHARSSSYGAASYHRAGSASYKKGSAARQNACCPRPRNSFGLVSQGRPFSEKWTSEDVHNVRNCSSFTVEKVNKLNPDAARGLTAQCLDQFSTTGLSKKILEKIPHPQVKNLTEKTANELLSGPIDNIPVDDLWIQVLIDKANWDELGLELGKKVLSNKEVTELVLETFAEDPKKIQALFTKKTFGKIPSDACKQLTREIISVIPPHAFAAIKPECLHKIPEQAFAGFTTKQFQFINSKALEAMTRAQADELTEDIIVEMSKKTATHWGRPVIIPQIESYNGSDYNSQRDAIKRYLQEHACMALEGSKKDHIKDPQTQKLVTQRCKDIWSNPLSKESHGAALKTNVTALLALCAALFMM